MKEKSCTQCTKTQPLENFPVDKSRKSGRHSVCRSCKSKYNKKYREKNAIVLALKSREYSKENAKRLAEYQKKYRKDNPEKVKEIKERYKKENKKKINAQQMVRMRIHRGTIKKLPCAVCKEPKTQAHHEDYDKPLEVVWLCHKHHQQMHRIH